jgi:hypothetical protein
MIKELWSDINGYENNYRISNTGKVYSRLSNKELSQNKTNGNGYKIVSLCLEGDIKNHYIHRLVAEHFIDNPNGDKIVNHLDSDRSNNNYWNLEWTDYKGNLDHCIDSGRKTDLGIGSPNTTITIEEITEIKRLRLEESLTYREISEIIGWSQSCVGQIIRGTRHSRQN